MDKCPVHNALDTADKLLEALTNLFDSVIFEELQSVSRSWMEKVDSVIKHEGESLTE
jgi:hypothetical protein